MNNTRDPILSGILLMQGVCLTAPLIDVCAKLAAATIPVGQITTSRLVVQAIVMAPIFMVMGYLLRIPKDMLGAVFLGYITFADFPDVLTWAGIGIVGASGLYIIHRERITARAIVHPLAHA